MNQNRTRERTEQKSATKSEAKAPAESVRIAEPAWKGRIMNYALSAAANWWTIALSAGR